MTARLYLYPRAGATLATLDVPNHPSDFQVLRDKVAGGALTTGGGTTVSVDGGFDRVRLVVERRSERLASLFEWRDRVHSLVDHLQRGGRIGFALDSDKAVLGQLLGNPAGLSSVVYGANLYGSWEASAALAADDRLVIFSGLPERVREENTVSSVSTSGGLTTVGLDRAVWFDHQALPAFIRHWGFYPCLKLDPEAAGEPLVVSERGFTFTLSIPLVEDLDTLADEAGGGADAIVGSSGAAGALSYSNERIGIETLAAQMRGAAESRFGG